MATWRHGPVEPDVVVRLLGILARVGGGGLEERAGAVVLANPRRYPVDATVVPVALALQESGGADVLRERALAHLRTRIALPLAPPKDWSRVAGAHVSTHARGADVDFTTLRASNTNTLVATKNQRTYDALAAQRTTEVERVARLTAVRAGG